jgi:Uma2 family endonuclease
MTVAIQPRLTFEDYLEICLRTRDRYELVRGELCPMNPPAKIHFKIGKFLERLFDSEIQRLNLPWEAFREIGQRTGGNSARLPDVAVVLSDEFEALPENQSAILQAPSILLVEIVSISSASLDYEDKKAEYQALGIREYWVVNVLPKKDNRVTVYTLQEDGRYQEENFRGNQPIISRAFSELTLTAEQVLLAKI